MKGKLKSILLGVGAIILVSGVMIGCALLIEKLLPESYSSSKEVADAVSDACFGKGVEQAAPYNDDSHIHPIVILDKKIRENPESRNLSLWHKWNRNLPEAWRAVSVNTTELVACLGDIEREVIENCFYDDGSMRERFYYLLTIQLIEAKTGKVISSGKFKGSMPPECPEIIRDTWKRYDIGGDLVDFIEVLPWFTEFVEGPIH